METYFAGREHLLNRFSLSWNFVSCCKFKRSNMALRAYTFHVSAFDISHKATPHIEASVKNISVKEAAEALGVTPRTIQYKLQNGDLKGTRTRNQYGKDEWRIYPTKQIEEAIARKTGRAQVEDSNFNPVDDSVLEAEDVTGEEFNDPFDWREAEIQKLEVVAEKLVRPLAERIEAQAIALREQEQIIADQKRALLLLPDLQKQAEEKRTAAELKELEAEALRKQIAAMEAIKVQAEESRRLAEEELQRLKDEKEAQVTAVQEQLQALTMTVQELQKPRPSWWKRLFSAPSEP